MMMMTAPTETAPMPISSRARSVSEDGDDDDVAAKRRHSFSTDCSARTIAVDGARLHDDRSSPIPDDDATREDARRCVNGEEKISLDALRALAEANADVARPDGFELHADVCATLLASERARGRDAVVTVDVGRAHHAPYRGELVEWILDVCAGERYGPTTADVAIAYTDQVLSKTVVPKTSLHLVALCCLQIAVKYEEIEERMPTMAKLRAWTSNMYSSDIIQKMELAVLVELKWELGVITPAHFLESFLAMTCNGTTAEDEVDVGVWTPRYREDLRQLVCQLYSLCVHDIELTNKPPSRVAAAVIATARLNLGLKPLCPPALRTVANVVPQQIYPIVMRIHRMWEEACADDETMDYVEEEPKNFNSLAINVPEVNAHLYADEKQRLTENASPVSPFDMHWDE